MVWRVDIEVVNKEVNEPPMGPHMSYPSADLIFGDLFDAEAIIDKEAGVIGYTISPLDIMTRLSGMSDSDIEAALEKTPETGWKGNVHHQRREVGDILSWIRSIEDIAMWAIDNGHDEIKVI